MSASGGTRAIIAALAANLGIAVSKFVAFAFTGSASMAAEGVHSLADSGNQVLLLVGGRRSLRVPDEEHPFGYGRTRYVYAFVVSIVLFSVGGLFAAYEGVHKILHPDELTSPAWAIGVLLVAIVLESRLAADRGGGVQPRCGAAGRGSPSCATRSPPSCRSCCWRTPARSSASCSRSSGVSLATLTDNGRWDGLGSLSIGLLLIAIAVFLALEMTSLLIGEAALPDEVAAIRAALEGTPEVNRVIHLRTLHLGPDEILVGAKIAVSHDDTAAAVARAIDAAEARVRAAVPTATRIYLEPDIDRAERPTS